MLDWNVVVSSAPLHYLQAIELLQQFGEVERSDYLNVLVMRVNDITGFLEKLHRLALQQPLNSQCLTRVIPVTITFVFQSHDDFEAKARRAVSGWLSQLANSTFHVRMRRRGFKGQLSSQQEEQFLDHFLIEQARTSGGDTRIDFTDPDMILALETVGQRAGLSLWSREQLLLYPLVKLD